MSTLIQSQIKNLVSQMTNKKLAKHNSQELQTITNALGPAADVQILLTFFQDIDFTEQR